MKPRDNGERRDLSLSRSLAAEKKSREQFQGWALLASPFSWMHYNQGMLP
jgi:hypothetical protein